LQRLVAEAGIAKSVKLKVFRDGKDVELSMTLSSAEAAPKQRRNPDADGGGQSGQADLLGLAVDDAEQGGVVVVDVAGGGAAAEAGIRRGDVIVSINRKKIANSSEYQRIIQQVGHGSMTILVRRGNASIYFALRIK
jgi:S1-C subfamily serine protease